MLGTRPEIIRLSPTIRLLQERGKSLGVDFFVIHTGQHYDYQMDNIFFKELELKEPKYNLKIGSEPDGTQTGKMLDKISKILGDERPDATIVYGDTNTTISGALASAKMKIPVVHIEAGCRSFDMNMPEEINRICTDHVSSMLFPPDKVAHDNLVKEGIDKSRIFMCGNPLIEACEENYEMAKSKSDIRSILKLEDYGVVTLHRQENVDNEQRFRSMLSALNGIDLKLVFPMHPRARKMVEKFRLGELLKNIVAIEPLGYIDFLSLIGGSKAVFTDSGGVQIESNILGVPCIVLRDTTEWVDELGHMSTLVSDRADLIIKAYKESSGKKKPDYSKHKGSSERIIKTIVDEHNKGSLNICKTSMV